MGITLDSLTVTWQTLLWFFGGFTAIAGGVAAIFKLFSPYRMLVKKDQQHDEALARDKAKLEGYDEAFTLILQTLFVLLNNQITGNSIDEVKKTLHKLQTYLASRIG